DDRAVMAARGYDGRLSLPARANWTTLVPAPAVPRFQQLRERASDLASASLKLGLPADAPGDAQAAFLDALLLGRNSGDLTDLKQSFRRVGLMHLFVISGAHMVMLMGLVWLVVRLLFASPLRASIVVLAILAAYLVVLPAQVPIVRSGVMAALLCI